MSSSRGSGAAAQVDRHRDDDVAAATDALACPKLGAAFLPPAAERGAIVLDDAPENRKPLPHKRDLGIALNHELDPRANISLAGIPTVWTLCNGKAE